MIDGYPEADHVAIQFHVHLVEVPPPVPEDARPADPPAADVAGGYRTEPVLVMTYRLIAYVGPAFEQQVIDVAQRQRKPHVHQHNQPDDRRRRVEATERTGRFARAGHRNVLTALP